MNYRILILVITITFFNCKNEVFVKDVDKIININDVEVLNTDTFDEFGGFGEGFTMETIQLSEKSVDLFLKEKNKDIQLMSTPSWTKFNWSTGNYDKSYKEVFSLIFNYSNGASKLDNKLKELKEILINEGTYYAFYYKPNKENPTDVQLFILDSKTRKLYALENNI